MTVGTIITVAGDATQGYSGDNGIATSAELNSPYGVAVDASGNIYIADEQNQVIRKVSSGRHHYHCGWQWLYKWLRGWRLFGR